MTTDFRQPALETPEIVSLLDEHHLVVVGRGPEARSQLAAALAAAIDARPDTEIIRIPGERTLSLDDFLLALETAMGVHRSAPRTLDGVIDLLRRSAEREVHRLFVWEHADACLEADVALFGRLAAALIGVAAEREHLDPNARTLQRTVFLGGDKLGACAEADDGPFGAWPDADEHDAFGALADAGRRPPVLMYRLDG